MQFETKVYKILDNFIKYLGETFEKVYAETVLFGMKDESETTIRSRDF